jgi:hypothetical protein
MDRSELGRCASDPARAVESIACQSIGIQHPGAVILNQGAGDKEIGAQEGPAGQRYCAKWRLHYLAIPMIAVWRGSIADTHWRRKSVEAVEEHVEYTVMKYYCTGINNE